jgi:hypothetical protein
MRRKRNLLVQLNRFELCRLQATQSCMLPGLRHCFAFGD